MSYWYPGEGGTRSTKAADFNITFWRNINLEEAVIGPYISLSLSLPLLLSRSLYLSSYVYVCMCVCICVYISGLILISEFGVTEADLRG